MLEAIGRCGWLHGCCASPQIPDVVLGGGVRGSAAHVMFDSLPVGGWSASVDGSSEIWTVISPLTLTLTLRDWSGTLPRFGTEWSECLDMKYEVICEKEVSAVQMLAVLSIHETDIKSFFIYLPNQEILRSLCWLNRKRQREWHHRFISLGRTGQLSDLWDPYNQRKRIPARCLISPYVIFTPPCHYEISWNTHTRWISPLWYQQSYVGPWLHQSKCKPTMTSFSGLRSRWVIKSCRFGITVIAIFVVWSPKWPYSEESWGLRTQRRCHGRLTLATL